MGIRFRCHHCESELHVKDFQAGKRGRCPECAGRFRVPLQDASHSLAPESPVLAPTQLAPTQPSADPDPAAQAAAADVTVSNTATAADAERIAPPHTPRRAPTDNPADIPTEGQTSPGAVDGGRPVDSSSAAQAHPRPTDAQLQPVQPQLPPPQPSPPQPVWPRALQVATVGKWYVRPPSGGQYGPAASDTMWQWLNENRVGRDALVWAEGWPEWIIAESAFDDFFQAPASSMAADAPPAQPAAAVLRHTAGNAPGELAAAPVTAAEPLLADRNRAERKQKRRRNYTLMIVGLTVIMLVLIATLVFVLNSQAV